MGLVNVSMMSSANNPTLCSYRPIVIPLMLGVDLIYSASGSIASEKINGDSGHPCLVPLVRGKVLEIIPDLSTLAVG